MTDHSGLDQRIGLCLASQEILERIRNGRITTSGNVHSRIQPSSFEPTLSGEVFMLDTETDGLFQPRRDQTVYQTLLELPLNRRRSASLAGGYELKKGFTYLLPLEERISMEGLVCVRSSPKSSTGRVFLNTRMVADYNPYLDEIGTNSCDKMLQLWLVVQPLAFNVVVRPGLSLNQLRFMTSYDAQLTPSEIDEEMKISPLLFTGADCETAAPHIINSDGLEIHLDLTGKATQGIIGLRARHNPESVDMSKSNLYKAEEFFEPLKGEGKMKMVRGEYYLLSTKEVLNVPSHLDVEVKRYSSSRFTGPLDFAGFVDNGFIGDLVLEPRSDELSSIVLEDGMPIGSLMVFRTSVPDKLYGQESGAHYQRQCGPKTAKFFKPFDFAMAAKNYDKLSRMVLVQDADVLLQYNDEGFKFLAPHIEKDLRDDIQRGFFQSRYDCEDDQRLLQIIPYVLLFGPDENIFVYQRADKIKDYGDQRLFGKSSIGLGGHIIPADCPSYLESCIRREVETEEVEIKGEYSKPRLMGTLMQPDLDVDKVHFGLIYALHTQGDVIPKESSIKSGRMVRFDELPGAADAHHPYETWSNVLIPHLSNIYRLSKP